MKFFNPFLKRCALVFLVLVSVLQIQAERPSITAHQPLSHDTLSYLKSREVPPALKKRLDLLFSKAPIKKLLTELYNAQDWIAVGPIVRNLEKHGFIFLASDHKPNIFSHKKFPDFIFKMAFPLAKRSEILNASRIAYADKIRAVIQSRKLKVKVPQKWAYFVQYDLYEKIRCGLEQAIHALNLGTNNPRYPQLIVVATKMDLTNAQYLTEKLEKDLEIIKKETEFFDIHAGNVVRQGSYALIIDTEEHATSTALVTQEAAGQKMAVDQNAVDASQQLAPTLSDIKRMVYTVGTALKSYARDIKLFA